MANPITLKTLKAYQNAVIKVTRDQITGKFTTILKYCDVIFSSRLFNQFQYLQSFAAMVLQQLCNSFVWPLTCTLLIPNCKIRAVTYLYFLCVKVCSESSKQYYTIYCTTWCSSALWTSWRTWVLYLSRNLWSILQPQRLKTGGFLSPLSWKTLEMGSVLWVSFLSQKWKNCLPMYAYLSWGPFLVGFSSWVSGFSPTWPPNQVQYLPLKLII